LLSDSQRDRIEVVLVSPRNPLNIGAVARAMANFGFARLTVVAPYEPHWREAQSAIGAENLLQKAKSAERLAEAVADCTLVVGTGTLTHRKPEQPVVKLHDLPPRLEETLTDGGRIALVFGPEKHGLTREDLSYCHLLVEIPTGAQQPSMNLGQAVAVCLYELAVRLIQARAEPDAAQPAPQPASTAASGDLDLLAGVIDQVMLASHYSPVLKRRANQHQLRLFLRRLALSAADARRILGFFRRVLHRLQE
jgi:TrmH family RNA methyltransferase